MPEQPIPPTAGQIRTTTSPSPSFDAVLTEHERDQADARAATAEAERDEARDERDELNQKIHAMRAALGYLPTADPIQCAIQTADALAEARQRIDALDAEATRWKTRLVHDTARLREHLDRANTERQRLAQELAAITAQRDQTILDLGNMRGIAQGNKRHVATLSVLLERVEKLTRNHKGEDVDDTLMVRVGELRRALNEPVDGPAPVPGSSRRAQETESVKYAGNPRRHAVAFNALTRALRIADRFVALSEREAVTTAVLNALDADAPQSGQGWDPTTPQWAVIRAAIAWRKVRNDDWFAAGGRAGEEDLALIEAVDALPHTGEPRVDLPTYGDNAPGTLRSRP